jgi:hypothetical protein
MFFQETSEVNIGSLISCCLNLSYDELKRVSLTIFSATLLITGTFFNISKCSDKQVPVS